MPTGPIVPDTSAWVEFLRRTGSRANTRLRDLHIGGADLVVTGPVVMELLAGARTAEQRSGVRGLLERCRYARVVETLDLEVAAAVYRSCSARGHTLGSQLDCLISAIATRIGAAVLHADADFDLIARHAPLRIA